jgi:hypothetical protein
MPRIDERIFPYSSDTASTNFTRACEVLAIEDLKYRDLRRDGISRLIEKGIRDLAILRECLISLPSISTSWPLPPGG